MGKAKALNRFALYIFVTGRNKDSKLLFIINFRDGGKKQQPETSSSTNIVSNRYISIINYFGYHDRNGIITGLE